MASTRLKRCLALGAVSAALLGSAGCSFNLGALKDLILAGIEGADDYIPPRAPPHIEPYIAPWPDPGFDRPSDSPVDHDGRTNGASSAVDTEWSPPGGGTGSGAPGSGEYRQVAPDAAFQAPRREDSRAAFAQ